MNKILIINPFGIGDVLFTTPVIKNLRLAYPEAKISYLANKRTADFLKFNPDINQVFVYERDEFARVYKRNPLEFVQKWLSLYKEIREGDFEIVFDYSMNNTFAYLCKQAGIKRHLGLNYRGRGRFLKERIDFNGFEDKHVVDYFLELLKFVKVPVIDRHLTLNVPEADLQWAKNWIDQNVHEKTKPLVAVFPGGGASWGEQAKYRLWGAANYAQLVDKIIENFDAAVILMGDSKDAVLCREVTHLSNFPLYDAVGKSSLLGLAALFKQCRAAVINDAGAVHVAVAVGVKNVSIYGPVDPKVYGPYPPEENQTVIKGLACQPCYRRFRMPACSHISCLRDLTVEAVYRKVRGIL